MSRIAARIGSRLAAFGRGAAFATVRRANFSVSKVAVSTLAVATFATATTTVAFCAPETAVVDYEAVKESIKAILDNPNYEDGSYGPLFLRLAWHAAGTYCAADGTGGSNGGRIRFHPEANWGANAGLGLARELLEKVKQQHPGITYADLYTLAGVVALEEMGSSPVPWKSGRVDFPDGQTSPADGRLPDATKKSDHLRDIFYRMGFNDREIVALSGAHSLGRCHADRSGFVGPWTYAPTTVSNEYFRLLLEEEWTPKVLPSGLLQYKNKSDDLMMLTSDLALVQDPLFLKYVRHYAKNEQDWKEDFAKACGKLFALGVPSANVCPRHAKKQ